MIDGVAIREIVGPDDPALPDYFDLYETAFPPNERLPVSNFLRVLERRRSGAACDAHLLAAVDETGALVGMARVDVMRACSVGYLVYLAVTPQKRSGGIGSAMFEYVAAMMRGESPPVVALVYEMDDPEHVDPAQRSMAERRIQFYRRLGGRLLAGIRYVQTVDHYPDGVPMHLGLFPFQALSAQCAFAIARCMFADAVTVTGEIALL